jgi:serine phosphatase RsbU (regulator of sigma subunit)
VVTFYDVHQASGGSWVAIGDVSGHGVTPGLIMMMVQSMLSALARQSPEVGQKYTPKEVLRIIKLGHCTTTCARVCTTITT